MKGSKEPRPETNTFHIDPKLFIKIAMMTSMLSSWPDPGDTRLVRDEIGGGLETLRPQPEKSEYNKRAQKRALAPITMSTSLAENVVYTKIPATLMVLLLFPSSTVYTSLGHLIRTRSPHSPRTPLCRHASTTARATKY
jgi:hypothetical protein